MFWKKRQKSRPMVVVIVGLSGTLREIFECESKFTTVNSLYVSSENFMSVLNRINNNTYVDEDLLIHFENLDRFNDDEKQALFSYIYSLNSIGFFFGTKDYDKLYEERAYKDFETKEDFLEDCKRKENIVSYMQMNMPVIKKDIYGDS